jgi:hypothetical protein
MNARDDEIQRLYDELNRLYCHDHLAEAKQVAEELATALGEPTPDSLRWHVHDWTLVWDARGNYREALRIQDLDIARVRAEIGSGDYDPYPELLVEEVKYLQDGFYLQAERHHKLGDRREAIHCLREIYALAERYHVAPDEDAHALLSRLTSEDDDA